MGKLIKSMVDVAEDIPITVKLRLGKSDGKINILETAKVSEDNGASAIIVHTRARSTKYKDDSSWDWLIKVKEQVIFLL